MKKKTYEMIITKMAYFIIKIEKSVIAKTFDFTRRLTNT